jgi:hypothetical protein
MRRILSYSSAAFMLAGSLMADQASLTGPVEGFTFDALTGSFRAVIGFPGSALLGQPIMGAFDFGSVAPQRDYGVSFQGDQGSFIANLGGVPSNSALTGVFARPEGVVWSGDGSVAILFSRSGGWVQAFAGFPGAASPGAVMDVSSLGGSLSAIAVDAVGKQVAIGIAGGQGGVFLSADGGGFVPLLPNASAIALAFSEDAGSLDELDGASLQVTQLHLADLTSQSFALEGLADPVAIKFGRDATNRQVLYAAGRNDRLFRAYDASSQQVLGDFPLDFTPSEIETLGRTSLMLAPRAHEGDPVWLFLSSPQPGVYFVPAGPIATGGQQ